MFKPTKHITNSFCALVFAAALFSMLAVNGANWYTEGFTQIKRNIESTFASFPGWQIEKGLKSVFGAYMSLTNRTYGNGVIVLDDGRLVRRRYTNHSMMFEKADEIIQLNDYLKSKGTPLVFVRAPDSMRDISQIPYGLRDSITTIEDTQQFLTHLTENGVEVLDLREKMAQDDIDYKEVFFHGDHHWNAYGSLYAYSKIGELLSNEYGFTPDESTWDVNEYEAITYRKAFIGSLSYRMGNTSEDVTALLPLFNTDIEVRNINPLNPAEHMEILAAGDFTEVFVPRAMESGITSFEYKDLNSYRRGFYRFTNHAVNNETKILFMSDSYGTVPVTYLSTAFKYVDYLYLHNDDNPKLYPLLAEEEYDFVFFLLSEGVILSTGDDFDEDRINLGMPVD